MLQLTPHHKIHLATTPIDFRKGIDKLAGICREHLALNPLSGGVFVFTNKKHSALKILVYDGQGFWLCLKRLSSGCFSWWPKAGMPVCHLSSAQLSILIHNGDPSRVTFSEDWRPVVSTN